MLLFDELANESTCMWFCISHFNNDSDSAFVSSLLSYRFMLRLFQMLHLHMVNNIFTISFLFTSVGMYATLWKPIIM